MFSYQPITTPREIRIVNLDENPDCCVIKVDNDTLYPYKTQEFTIQQIERKLDLYREQELRLCDEILGSTYQSDNDISPIDQLRYNSIYYQKLFDIMEKNPEKTVKISHFKYNPKLFPLSLLGYGKKEDLRQSKQFNSQVRTIDAIGYDEKMKKLIEGGSFPNLERVILDKVFDIPSSIRRIKIETFNKIEGTIDFDGEVVLATKNKVKFSKTPNITKFIYHGKVVSIKGLVDADLDTVKTVGIHRWKKLQQISINEIQSMINLEKIILYSSNDLKTLLGDIQLPAVTKLKLCKDSVNMDEVLEILPNLTEVAIKDSDIDFFNKGITKLTIPEERIKIINDTRLEESTIEEVLIKNLRHLETYSSHKPFPVSYFIPTNGTTKVSAMLSTVPATYNQSQSRLLPVVSFQKSKAKSARF